MSSSQFDRPLPAAPAEPSGERMERSDAPPNGTSVLAVQPGDPKAALALPAGLGRKRRSLWPWFFGVLALGAAIIIYFEYVAPQGPDRLYRTSPVEKRAIRQTVEAFGSLDVVSRRYVPAPRQGQLAEIFVRRGSTVREGEPLARLDETLAAADLSAAETALDASAARVERARAARASAADERARLERLLERGLVSASAVAAARNAEAEATAAVRAAEAQRELDTQARSGARQRRDETTLRAPVPGFVLSAPDDVGGIVGPQTGPLFVITPPLTELLLTVPISEADIGLVRVGQSAVFSVSAHPDRRFPAQVNEIESEPQRTGSSVSYRVRLRVQNPDQVLLPGMTANVTLEIAQASEALAVREAALRFSPDNAETTSRSRVFRLNAMGGLEVVKVVAGLSDGAYTAVTPAEGFALEPGDEVAIGFAAGSSAPSKSGPGISLGNKP